VGRIALATLVLAGLAAPAGAAAATPSWTARGPVTRLNPHSITVSGKSCRVTSASPGRSTLRIIVVGSRVKIECAGGVLLDIDLLHPLPPMNPVPLTPTTPSTSSSSASSMSLAMTKTESSANGTTVSSTTLTGNFAITGLANGSITAGIDSQSATCRVGDGSPDVSGFRVGDRLSRLDCRDGVLTSLTRA
jgi:hypothetical protein